MSFMGSQAVTRAAIRASRACRVPAGEVSPIGEPGWDRLTRTAAARISTRSPVSTRS